MARWSSALVGAVGSLALAACGGVVSGASDAAAPFAPTAAPPPPAPEWTVDAGGTGTTSAVGVGAFSDGTVMMTGAYDQDVVLGRGTPNETSLAGTGRSCVFVSRYESDGSLRWARSARGTGYVAAYGTAILPDDSIVVAGFFSETASFDGGVGGATTVTAAGIEAGFLAKYAGDGTLVWVRSVGPSDGYAEVLPVAALSDGSIAVGGLFSGQLTLGAGEANETLLLSASLEAFVARYAADGSLLWARSTVTPIGYATAWAIAGTSDLGIVASGEVNGTTVFGADGAGAARLTSEAGTDDVWVARYSSTGDFVWARRIAGPQEDEVYSIAVAGDDSVRVGGYFRDATLVDADGPSPLPLVAKGGIDAYVASFSGDGSPLWAHAIGGAGDDFAICVAATSDGSTVVTGGFHGPVDFDGSGPAQPLALNDTADTAYDVFVVRYGPGGTFLSVRVGGGPSDDMGIAVSVDETTATVLVGGSYSGTAAFVPAAGDTALPPLTASGATDAFLARLHTASAP